VSIRAIRGCFIRFELAKNNLFLQFCVIGYADLKVRVIRGLLDMLSRGVPRLSTFVKLEKDLLDLTSLRATCAERSRSTPFCHLWH
jgi:hypothetical protein